jgi:hypothetical protein
MVGKHYKHDTPFPKIYTTYNNANYRNTALEFEQKHFQALGEENC